MLRKLNNVNTKEILNLLISNSDVNKDNKNYESTSLARILSWTNTSESLLYKSAYSSVKRIYWNEEWCMSQSFLNKHLSVIMKRLIDYKNWMNQMYMK